MAITRVTERRPVHRRGFLSGQWLVPGEGAGEAGLSGNAPSILMQVRPDRVAGIAARLEELGIGTVVPGSAPSRFSITLADGVTVADGLSSVADIPGVLAATLAAPSAPEGGA